MTETVVHSLRIEYAADGEWVFVCPRCGYTVMVTDDARRELRVIEMGDPLARHTTGKVEER